MVVAPGFTSSHVLHFSDTISVGASNKKIQYWDMNSDSDVFVTNKSTFTLSNPVSTGALKRQGNVFLSQHL